MQNYFSDQSHLVQQLESLVRLKKLSQQSKDYCFQNVIEKKVLAGVEILSQGTEAEFCYFIISGYLKWERVSSQGVNVLLDIHGPCESPGELAVRLGVPYPASGVTLTPVHFVKFKKSIYMELLKSDSGFSETTSLCLASRAHGLLGRITEDGGSETIDRMGAFLLRIAQKFGKINEHGLWSIPFYLSRKDLAAAVGCRIETAIRLVKQWKNKKKIFEPSKGLEKHLELSAEFYAELCRIHEGGTLLFGSECSNCHAKLDEAH